MKRRLNWTDRSRIHRKDISAEFQWNNDEFGEWPTLIVDIDLEDYEHLPENGLVFLEAYRRASLAFVRESWGTVDKLRETNAFDLDEFSREELPQIRIMVVEADSGIILARSASFTPKNPEDKIKMEKELQLINFAYQDIGDRIYKIDYPETLEDYPTLVLNDTIPEVRSFLAGGKPWGPSLIYPNFVNDVLNKILIENNETYDENGTDWKSIWLRSMSKLLGASPPDNNTDRYDSSEGSVKVEREIWIENATDRFCAVNNLKVKLVNYLGAEVLYD